MVNLQIYWSMFFAIIPLTASQNAPSEWCSTESSIALKKCHHLQVPAPFPVECETIPVVCYEAENLLDVSSKVFVNSQRFFDKQLYKDFLNNSSPYVESGRWEVKLKRMQSVYSVLIRTLGDESSSLSVNVSRRISNNETETTKCDDYKYYSGYHSFVCYSPQRGLGSNNRPGFDTHFLEISGDIYIDSRDFRDVVKLYSYPIPVCSSPESYENESVMPQNPYFLVGQQVTYTCDDDERTLIGNPNRTCQHNGLWSGETPVCVLTEKFLPQTRFLSSTKKLEPYLPATSLVNATRLNENGTIIYGLKYEFCIERILVEYHSELSQRTNIALYTTTVNGSKGIWSTNGSFGEYANKKYFFPNDQKYLCGLDVIVQRHEDTPSRDVFKRLEFLYKIEMIGFRHQGVDCLKPNLLSSVQFTENQNHTIQNGTMVFLKCENGYSNSNGKDLSALECSNGVWKGAIPLCERRLCSQPRSRKYLSWKYLANRSNYYKVEYDCDLGFKLKGHKFVSCENGKWTAPPPLCEVTFCPRVTIPPNLYCMQDRQNEFYDINGNGTSLHHGIELVCYCLPGFYLVGNRTTHCYNQQWTSSLPECQEIFCKNAPFIANSDTSDRWARSHIRWKIGPHNFSCPTSFTIKGQEDRDVAELNCQENGEWMETELFECVRRDMPSEQVGVVVAGIFLSAMFFSFPCFLFIKKCFERINQNERTRRGENNLTIPADLPNESYYAAASYDYENDVFDGNNASQTFYPTAAIIGVSSEGLIESSDSEIEVVY